MIILNINRDNQTEQWWINFLLSLCDDNGTKDLKQELEKWGAQIYTEYLYEDGVVANSIRFEKEKDFTWFMLRWS